MTPGEIERAVAALDAAVASIVKRSNGEFTRDVDALRGLAREARRTRDQARHWRGGLSVALDYLVADAGRCATGECELSNVADRMQRVKNALALSLDAGRSSWDD